MASDLKALEARIRDLVGGAVRAASAQHSDWRTRPDAVSDEIIRWVADVVEDENADLRAALARTEETAAQYKAESERLGDFANAKVQQITAAKAALARIAEAHSKHVDEHGGTTGACNECSWNWPCPTYAWATTNRDPNGPWDPADDEESADV